jgi:hypothetical protein
MLSRLLGFSEAGQAKKNPKYASWRMCSTRQAVMSRFVTLSGRRSDILLSSAPLKRGNVGMRRSDLLLALVALAALLTCGVIPVVPQHPAQAAFSGENGKITFIASEVNSEGNSYPTLNDDPGIIEGMNADGSDRHWMPTVHDGYDNAYYPAWSPDGTKLAIVNQELVEVEEIDWVPCRGCHVEANRQ